MIHNKPNHEELEKQLEYFKKELERYRESDEKGFELNNNINFHDLFDIKEIQKIQDLFAQATGVASIITYPDGKPITAPSNFCRLCIDIIRKTEKGLKNCYHSDAEIGKQNIGSAIYQPCLSGGLWDGGASISVGGKHIANWLIGQVKNEDIDEEKMLLYAKEIGADETEFKKALGEVTVMSTEKFKKIADTLFYFANELSQQAYQNIKQKRLISELRKKEEELIKAKEIAEKNEQHNQMLFEILPIGLALAKMTGELVYVNKAYTDIIGYSIDECLKLTYWDITPEKYADQEQIQLNNLNTLGFYGPYEKEYRHKSGMLIPVRLIGRTVTINNEKFIWSSIENISIKKQTEQELLKAKEKAEESELKYRTIFEGAPIGIFRSTKDGRFIEVNQALATMLGYQTPKEVVENIYNISEQIYVETSKRCAIINSATKENIQKFENIYKRKNGEHFFANLYLREIIDEKGCRILEGMVEETTNMIKKEQELIVAKEKAEESDRLKTAFLQNMSHEIRTPMNAIIGFSDFLEKPDLPAEKIKSFTSIIKNSSYQLLSIITDILSISAIQTNQERANIGQVCINNIITDLLSIFKNQAYNQNISLYSKQPLTDHQSEIFTDKTKLTQILTNLITNALKFTHEGFIEFGYRLLQTGKTDNNNGISAENNELMFYVKDSGIGIKAEMLDKIFERFRQANENINKKYGGTGLGLAISKAYTELLGGKIWVQSEPEKGSTFYFTIPYNPVNHTIDGKTPLNNKKKITILIAEDEEYNFLYLEELLKNTETDIIHTKDGQETIEFCRKNTEINLLLMDIKMPIMDGYTAAKQIKEFRPELKIIAQSAYALEHEKVKYSGTTFDDYITKPIDKNKLKQLISKYIDV